MTATHMLAIFLALLACVTGGAAEPSAKPGLAQSLAEALGRGDLAAYRAAVESWLDRADRAVPESPALDRWREVQRTPGYLHGLAALRDIWAADPPLDAVEDRRLATAVALVFHTEPQKHRLRDVASRDHGPLTPAARYAFFKESRKAGKLRPSFDALAAWELRWIVCAPVENEALAWLQEHVSTSSDCDSTCISGRSSWARQ